MPIDTPVVLIIFRRPDTTRRVFEAIREARPKQLFIVADGPRTDIQGEKEKCQAARDVVADIDWDCEVYRNYADENMGCGVRPATGITWVFEHVDRAIILEDDCLPTPSFFHYCEELLERYQNDDRVMHINGNNYGLDQSYWHDYSYGFCSYPQAWGWATWRRAWQHFDFSIADWPAFKESGLVSSLDGGDRFASARERKWDHVYNGGDDDIWDYQWHFSVISRGGLTVSPVKNLVSNIGFSEEGTHTTNPSSHKSRLQSHQIDIPLRHPPFRIVDKRIDRVYRHNMLRTPYHLRVYRKLKHIISYFE